MLRILKDKKMKTKKRKAFGFRQHGLIIILLISTFSCVSKNNKSQKDGVVDVKVTENPYKGTFYQYNIWWGFVNKVFDGDLTVKALKKRGDIALGSYTQLDGELVMLDGIPYRIREDGSVSIPKDEDKIVYVDAAFFEGEYSFEIDKATDFNSLIESINEWLPTPNKFYTFKISGTFNYMKCGGLNKQEKPYTDGLDVLIPKRPVFERNDVKGTIVGFYCPEFIGNINVAGYHFHFISDDKTLGGHVMAFNTQKLKIESDALSDYHFTLPDSDDFNNVSLDKEYQYGDK